MSDEPTAKRTKALEDGFRRWISYVSKKVALIDRTWVVKEPIKAGEEIFRVKEMVSMDRILELEPSFDRLLKVKTIHPIEDCVLAAFLASKNEQYAPYLDSLPRDPFLPRHWPPEELEELTGSPVLKRIEEQKTELRKDFEVLELSISWEDWDRAMAWVTSRAFHNDKGPVMVPCLDMCNHTRKKNVSYTFNAEGCTAVASCDIPEGQALEITYGAQSNSNLLFNYGFCYPNNREPDGSYNDTLEFAEGTFLRLGPKSYTYGPFCKALDSFLPGNDEEGSRVDDADDMEEFLNGCDEEGKEEMGLDLIGGGGEMDGGNDSDEEVAVELHCLKSFENELKDRRKSYRLSLEEIMKRKKDASDSGKVYPPHLDLLESEHCIIRFHLGVIMMLQQDLGTFPNCQHLRDFYEIDEERAYAEELSEVYFKIRHS